MNRNDTSAPRNPNNRFNLRRLIYGFHAICLLLLATELIYHRHTAHPWEGIPGFYSVYGFVACVMLVLFAKLMRRYLMRADDYYADGTADRDAGEEEPR